MRIPVEMMKIKKVIREMKVREVKIVNEQLRSNWSICIIFMYGRPLGFLSKVCL